MEEIVHEIENESRKIKRPESKLKELAREMFRRGLNHYRYGDGLDYFLDSEELDRNYDTIRDYGKRKRNAKKSALLPVPDIWVKLFLSCKQAGRPGLGPATLVSIKIKKP